MEGRAAIHERPRWLTTEAVKLGLAEIEHSISGGEGFLLYLDKFRACGQSQCTTVWTKTAIAYRCRTCQVNDSSAICVSCFQAGDHRNHDYVMYHSDSGGCCDCGDPAAWKEEGFCSVHHSSCVRVEPVISAHLFEITGKAVEFVVEELCAWLALIVEAKSLDRNESSTSNSRVLIADRYIRWLQKICSVGALRNLLCEVFTTVVCPVPVVQQDIMEKRSTVEIMLLTYGKMPDNLMEAMTTLILQMLYDQQFKDTFSRALISQYAQLIVPASVNPFLIRDFKVLDQSLDRVMVQLFNVPEITLNLIQTDRLLENFISVLGSVLSQCANRKDGTLDVDHPAIKGRVAWQVYGRPQGDLKLIVAHENVSIHVLKDRPDVFEHILSILALLQWMNPYSSTSSVDLEEQALLTQAITLEWNMMTIPFGLIGRCFSGFPGNEDAVKCALTSAARVAMESLRQFLRKVEESGGSCEKMSLHIPLHRVLAAVVSKLVMLPWNEDGQGFLERLHPAPTEAELLTWMEHPLRVITWIAEIRAQIWQDNSSEFSRLELIYRGSIWHECSMDMDILMLQFCSAARENMGHFVITTMAKKFGLFELVSEPLLNSELVLTPAKMSMLQDFLRLLLLVIRERRNTGMSETESLRYDVIQWLCVRDHTYSQLAYALGGLLADNSKLTAVLQEVAVYNDPKVQERGYYQLKQECWREFDPLFAHFYANDLEEAQERAINVGKIPHYWRLLPLKESKPPFGRLVKILHSQACHQLIWNVIHNVTVLIHHEETATSAEAIGVMVLQILEMALADIRGSPAESSVHRCDVSEFIFSKPHVDPLTRAVVWHSRESSSGHPSVYEMLVKLQKYKDSFRLVDFVNYIIQLQCSYSISKSYNDFNSSETRDAYDERRKLKKKRQEAILADFKARQKAFLDQAHYEDEFKRAEHDTVTKRTYEPGEEIAKVPESSWVSIPDSKFLNPGSSAQSKERHECAFCRCECDADESPTGWIALVQRYNIPSVVHGRGRAVQNIQELPSLSSATLPRSMDFDRTTMLTIVSGIPTIESHPTEHVRCCGHQMHQLCFQRYVDSLLKRHYAKTPYEGKGIIDLGKMEFLCPICRRLANVLLPDVTKAIPWLRVDGKQLQTAEAFQDMDKKTKEDLTDLSLENLRVVLSRQRTAEMEYWKQYWIDHGNLADSIRIFAAQCLRVRYNFLREPPDLDGFALCQLYWEVLAENILHCEVETRGGLTTSDVGAASSSAFQSVAYSSTWKGDAAHWLGLTELAKLAMLTSTIPCAEKQQRWCGLFQWLGLDGKLAACRADNVIEASSDDSVDVSSARARDRKQSCITREDLVEKPEYVSLDAAYEKKDVESQSSQGRKISYLHIGADDRRYQRRSGRLKFSQIVDSNSQAAFRLMKKHTTGTMVGKADVTDIGWLWSNSRSKESEVLTAGDPFEFLIMLLVTFEGWPTLPELMAMVRVSYVLAATQASVAYNKLNGGEDLAVFEKEQIRLKVLQGACLPFLRRVSLMVHVFWQNKTETLSDGRVVDLMESTSLLEWLNLPDVEEAVQFDLQGRHGMKVEHLCHINQSPPFIYLIPRQARLTELPEVFQELVLQNLEVACSNCRLKPSEPAICLVCGKLFCCGTECCNVEGIGECYRHADKESAGVGIFLLIRSTQLVLLRNSRVCMAPSLYLDLHGEEDAYLKRGYPLHLCHLRLNEVTRLWQSAALDHETHILHTSQIGGLPKRAVFVMGIRNDMIIQKFRKVMSGLSLALS